MTYRAGSSLHEMQYDMSFSRTSHTEIAGAFRGDESPPSVLVFGTTSSVTCQLPISKDFSAESKVIDIPGTISGDLGMNSDVNMANVLP